MNQRLFYFNSQTFIILMAFFSLQSCLSELQFKNGVDAGEIPDDKLDIKDKDNKLSTDPISAAESEKFMSQCKIVTEGSVKYKAKYHMISNGSEVVNEMYTYLSPSEYKIAMTVPPNIVALYITNFSDSVMTSYTKINGVCTKIPGAARQEQDSAPDSEIPDTFYSYLGTRIAQNRRCHDFIFDDATDPTKTVKYCLDAEYCTPIEIYNNDESLMMFVTDLTNQFSDDIFSTNGCTGLGL